MAISFAKARMGFFRLKDKTYLINIFGNRYPFVEVPFLTSNQALEFSWATHHYQGIDAASVPLIVFLVTIILVRSVRSGERRGRNHCCSSLDHLGTIHCQTWYARRRTQSHLLSGKESSLIGVCSRAIALQRNL